MSAVGGPDPARRAFLRGELLTRAGRERLARRERPLGPLPPGTGSAARAGDCLACARPCASACPSGLVAFHPAEHALASLPYLVFARGGCDFCGACAAACPASAALGPPRLGLARVDAERCLAGRGIVCLICAGACPARAIGPDALRFPLVDAAACSGCGRCVAGCPARAISIVPAAA